MLVDSGMIPKQLVVLAFDTRHCSDPKQWPRVAVRVLLPPTMARYSSSAGVCSAISYSVHASDGS